MEIDAFWTVTMVGIAPTVAPLGAAVVGREGVTLGKSGTIWKGVFRATSTIRANFADEILA